MSESPISRAIGKWLDHQQALNQLTHDRYNSGVGARGGRYLQMAQSGTSDRIIRVPLHPSIVGKRTLPRPVMCEVKDEGKAVLLPSRCVDWRDEKMRKKYAQYLWLERQRGVGAYCCVVHSVAATKYHIERAKMGVVSPGPEQWAQKTDMEVA